MTGALLRVRESFWFLPASLGLLAVVLAEALVLLDRSLPALATDRVFFLDSLSASGGRSLLSVIGSSMLTVAGTSFSITISVLATTSSTYGPRLVRNFMADRANQFVLATFTSTFLYAIVVMRTVHTEVDDASAFVPVIAVHVAVLLGVLDVGVLVFFIHHIARSVQITSLQGRVMDDLRGVAAFVYPDEPGEGLSTDPARARPTDPDAGTAHGTLVGGADGTNVRAASDGYVQAVAWEQLRRSADGAGLVDVVAMPGSHVIEGDVLVTTDRPAPSATVKALRRAFTLGVARTPHQDVSFALQQLVEIAVRGLASGSNDPYTAVSALDHAAGVLVPLWRRGEAVTALVDDSGAPLVRCSWPAVEELVDSVFDAVDTYAQDQPAVLEAATRLLRRLDAVAPPTREGRLSAHEARLERALA
ncbi:DUF2254 domain-containing protein [Frigoribacterium salinisoli]